jgi:hypothetical protein
MLQQSVQELLAEWREAERQLELTVDAASTAELRARVDELRTAYQEATAVARTSSEQLPEGEPA